MIEAAPETMAAPLAIDHLTILSRSSEAASAFYDMLLPKLGFWQVKPGIWRNKNGMHFQFRLADAATRDYDRYGPGLNHLGFTAPSPDFVRHLHGKVTNAGYEARLQTFADGTVALFIPDPDGLRFEISWYPEGVAPVS